MMAIDEELLKPIRVHLAKILGQIASLEAEMHEKIKRYGAEDKEYARELWRDFHLAVEPLRREQEAVAKVIADYYALQPMPPQIIVHDQLPPLPPNPVSAISAIQRLIQRNRLIRVTTEKSGDTEYA